MAFNSHNKLTGTLTYAAGEYEIPLDAIQSAWWQGEGARHWPLARCLRRHHRAQGETVPVPENVTDDGERWGYVARVTRRS